MMKAVGFLLVGLLLLWGKSAEAQAIKPIDLGPEINVKSYGAKGNGTTDDTAAITAALAVISGNGGGTLVFPSGTYLVSTTQMALSSNTRITGIGGAKLVSTSTTVGAFQGTSISNVQIDNLSFSWPILDQSPIHILDFTTATNVRILNNNSDGAGNFTAMRGTTKTLEQGNYVTGVSNACYDHWQGFTDAQVINNYCSTAVLLAHGNFGIAFTGINTDGTAANSSGGVAIGNVIYINSWNGQGIVVNGHASGGTDDDIIISNNKITVTNSTGNWGILVTDHANNIEIHDNIFIGSNTSSTYSAIGAFSTATNVRIHDNQAINWNVATNSIFDNTTVGGSLVNNVAYGSTGALLTAVATTLVSGNSTGIVAYSGSGASAIPACSATLQGNFATVTDGKASPTAAGAYAAGDGAAKQPVWCNGSGWVYVSGGGGTGTTNLSTLAATSNSQISAGTLPANSFLLRLLLHETAGHAVNISLGTTSGASDVLAAQSLSANGTLIIDIAGFDIRWFSGSQAIFITSASWGSASVNAQLDYEVAP